MPTRFQLDARSWRVLILGLLLMAAFAHTLHVCPGLSDLAGSPQTGSSSAPCLVCAAMQAIALVLCFSFVGLTPIPVRAAQHVPATPLRPAYRLSSFTRPPPAL